MKLEQIITENFQTVSINGILYSLNTDEKAIYDKIKKEENKKLEQELNWEKNYGTLSDGYYRIVKKINNKDIVVEFEIESLK